MANLVVIAYFKASKDYLTRCSSASYAASVNILMIILHPDLRFLIFDLHILAILITINSLISTLVCKLLSMMVSKGFKKSF